MPKDDSGKLKNHIHSLRSLVRDPELRKLSKSSGELGIYMIDKHVENGRYAGGPYKNKGYSDANLPAFFFGKVRYVARTGNIRVDGEEGPSNVLFKKDEIHWGAYGGRGSGSSTSGGYSTAYVKGGYRSWLKKTRPGKNLNKVDLNYNGDMLRNLDYEVKIKSKKSEISFFVRPPEDKKAYYTHLQRHWLTFFPDEVDKFREQALEKFGIMIKERLSSK